MAADNKRSPSLERMNGPSITKVRLFGHSSYALFQLLVGVCLNTIWITKTMYSTKPLTAE